MRNFWVIIILFTFFNCTQAFCIGDTTLLKEIQITEFLRNKLFFKSMQKIDSSILVSYQNRSLTDLLNEQTLVTIKNYGAGGIATISLRGTNASHTKLIWNGISLNSPMLGLFDYSTFPVFSNSKISIISGGQSAEFGAGAIGGVINVDDEADYGSRFKLSFSQQMGSFGRSGNSFNLQFGNNKFQSSTFLNRLIAKNDFLFVDYQKFSRPKVKLENASTIQEGVRQSFDWRPNSKRIFSLNSWFQYNNRNLAPQIGNANNVSTIVDRSFRNSLEYREIINSKVNIQTNIGYVRDFLLFKNRLKLADSIAELLSSQSISEIYTLSSKLNFKPSDKYNFQFIAEGFKESAKIKEYGGLKARNRYSIAASVSRYFFNKGIISANARKEFNDLASPFIGSLHSEFNLFGKRGIKLLNSISTNYALPTLNDLYWKPGGNINLNAEKSFNVDIALEKKIILNNISINNSITAYWSKVNDWILWQPSLEYNGNWSPQNLKRVRTSGFESTNEIKWTRSKDSFSFRLNYSYTQAINKKSTTENDQSVGKQLIYIPLNSGLAQIKYQIKTFQIRYGTNYYGYRFTTSDHSDFLPSYVLSQINFQKSFGYKKYQIEIDAGIYNLFNKTYQNLPDRAQPGRNFLIQFNLKYK